MRSPSRRSCPFGSIAQIDEDPPTTGHTGRRMSPVGPKGIAESSNFTVETTTEQGTEVEAGTQQSQEGQVWITCTFFGGVVCFPYESKTGRKRSSP